MPADHQLLNAYEKISSSKITERGSGLNDLKLLLTRGRNPGGLDDKGFHKMYETVFRATVLEKSLYRKQSKSALRTTSAARLQTCGSVLRAAVELGVGNIKLKTVRAVYKHIVDLLPSGEGLCEPISVDYLKALRVLFQHTPHTEHLLPEEWDTLAEFCCTNARAQLKLPDSSEDDEEDGQEDTDMVLEDRGPRRRGPVLARESSTASRRSATGGSQQFSSRLTHESEELLLCLRYLLAAPNAPILPRVQMISDTLLGFLRSQSTYTRAHHHVFSSLNLVLNVVTTNDIVLIDQVSDAIVPIISRIWDTKTPGLKDEMLVSLIYCHPYIRARIRRADGEALRRGVEDLFESLCAEYIARSDREILHLDDVAFPSPTDQPGHTVPHTLRSIALRHNAQNPRSEEVWAIPSLIARLVEMLDASSDLGKSASEHVEAGGTRKKRQRMYSRFAEVMRFVRSNNSSRKLLALQVISFLADLKGIDEAQFPSIMQDVLEASSDDNLSITAWSLVSFGSYAFLNCASDPANSGLWGQVWQICVRHAANQSTCRIACHVMRIIIERNLVAYTSVSKDIDHMLQSVDANGPATLSDSSLALGRLILEKQSTVVQSAGFHIGERLFQWFTSKWRPAQEGLEKSSALAYSHHAAPVEIVNFLAACCGIDGLSVGQCRQRVCGPIGQASIRMVQYRGIIKTLLLEDDGNLEDVEQGGSLDSNPATVFGSPSPRLQEQVVAFLERQMAVVVEKWRFISTQKQGTTGILAQNFVGFVLALGAMWARFTGEASAKARYLDAKLREKVHEDLCRYLGSEECSQKQIDGVLLAIGGFLPAPKDILNTDSLHYRNIRGTTGHLLSLISEKLEERDQATVSFNQSERRDAMDIDDDVFGFPDNGSDEQIKGRGLPRERLEALCSEETFRASTTALLVLCTLSQKCIDLNDICSQFIEYLSRSSGTRLVLMGPVIKDFLLAAECRVPDGDAASVCVHLAAELLQDYNLERCETSIGVCVDAVTALVPKWACSDRNTDLANTCEHVFDHAVKMALSKRITSYSIQNSIAILLERILSINPDYRKDPLTMFIGLLEDRDCRVIFFVAQRLHILFTIFGESAHLKLTEDIEARLPSDKAWAEGLAMRVHSLGLVALASLSNISRVIYRIFETGQLPDAEQYAARVLLEVAKASGLGTQRGLFQLFCSKLIFTWTEYYDLQDFPSLVFGYEDLTEMCQDVPEELVAQLVAKGKDENAEFVAEQNGVTLNALLRRSFSKVVAYSLAWAVGFPPLKPKDGEMPKPTTTMQIRKRIGDGAYSELFLEHFPSIISNLYQLMHDDGSTEKLLSRDSNLADVYDTLKEITAEGHSVKLLVRGLDPQFKTRVILNAIHHACATVSLDDKHDLWTPAMVTFVARKLFNTLHPAQGPIHTCGVIRNIRLLICLAGPKALEGYPLKMLIQGLKSYVIDSACAEDTVGILRYLLSRGNEYLSKHPSFVTGTFLSILASLREYSQAALKMDQQDTQTQTTLSVVQSFRPWLAKHLAKLVFPALSPKQNAVFRSIIESAAGFRDNGNALKDTKEGQFLRLILDDDMSTNKLLDDTSRQLAFTLICSDFSRPESFREDIFGADEQSFERSKSLLRISTRSEVNDGFLLWSARVLGRAYASTGQLHNEWTREMEFDNPVDIPARVPQIDNAPKVAILRRLKALLFSDDKGVVELAESTLAQIINEEAQLRESAFTWVLAEDEYNALHFVEMPAIKDRTCEPIKSFAQPTASFQEWTKDLTVAMTTKIPGVPVIKCLNAILQKVHGLAEELFQFIAHILLAKDLETPNGMHAELSDLFQACFKSRGEKSVSHNTLLIKTVLYLRSQPISEREPTKANRDAWLDINYLDAAYAACVCKMFKTALLFAEMHSYAVPDEEIPTDLLLQIFKNVDDPDSFYGVSQTFNLQTVMDNFEYEGDGWKSLSFRGADLESRMRLGTSARDAKLGIIDSLNTLGVNGLSYSFLQSGTFSSPSGETVDNIYRSAWKLETWDLPCPASVTTRSAPIYRALQSINNTVDSRPVSLNVDPHFLDVMKQITAGSQTGHTLGGGLRTLAMLAEMEEVFVSKDDAQLDQAWERLQDRTSWMETGKYADVEEMMAMRQATFGSLAKRDHLRAQSGIDKRKARYLEAQALVGCCKMARKHSVLQHALSAATQLSMVVEPCREVGLDISAVATLQVANVLWEDSQSIPSIRMLTALENDKLSASQSMVIGRAKLLAKIGNRISEARLEKPDKIMSGYLEKAIRELKRDESGSEAGRVYHEFASFCDQQLQNPSNIEDFQRASKLREDKQKEVDDLRRLIPKSTAKDNALQRELAKAERWLRLDNEDFDRLKSTRDTFVEKSVQNYLRCLAACNDYDGDAVRFSALWLANAGVERVNKAACILNIVPSKKLVPLMNQLSSRLLNETDTFQRLLSTLISKICYDHPYHGIYQILALSKTRGKDETAISRQKAAMSVVERLQKDPKSRDVVVAIDSLTQSYEKLAHAKYEKLKGSKTTLSVVLQKDRDRARKFERDIPSYGIPPPTMHIDTRADCDYSSLPRITRYDSAVVVAGGLSAPKVITCESTDGNTFKQLVKGGQDDLRQDAIMEQVFEQVSVLLQKGRITRQRNLKIRTYKVIPLSATSGIIEFVANTLPLSDWLIPAHHKYYPRHWKATHCRTVIREAKGKSREVQISEFHRVVSNFPPAMHFFFMHEFNGPDEWFSSRLAYTRSNAAISILGHVLGLGDRHIHNILLDTKTGEVVHIDLGVAFEQGRVLPVPEVVPFRLTRDIVDGMGITKTEGVFRRCCEFTLEVLRNEAYSITTILDVLRYDPLYSWSMSPLRMKRIQETHLEQSIISARPVDGPKKPNINEGEAEADRCLTVVAKKLSKTLSVGATVNELIQQASDERNLALLYEGWSAYA